MSVVLYRVDERLIHGQVVVGWGHSLRPDRYVIADDELAASDWEQELYRLAAGDVEVVFCTVEAAREGIAEWATDASRSVVLMRDVATLRTFARDGRLRGARVDLGGVHHGPGRREVLPYLHLSEEERVVLQDVAAEGVDLGARDLPDAPRVALEALLAR